MAISFGIALCVAYLMGLLLSPVAGAWFLWKLPLPWIGIAGCSGLCLWGTIAPHRLKLGWRFSQWLGLGSVFLLATVYMLLRSPVAGAQDISRYVERAQAIAQTQVITGKLTEDPILNRDLKGRFRVAVRQLQVIDQDGEITFQIPVRGQIYVTAPLLQVTGLHEGQLVKARGRLYRPQPTLNPNGFDFSAYLAQKNTFSGFVAEELRFRAGAGWGLWRVRQRIVRTQVRALGSPLGQLVSAMALGRKAVDLPMDIQELFSRVGLAHTIAASGFHVSLLLGTVLALLRSCSVKVKVAAGLAILLGYVTLTGLQPSVLRAALMGGAALVGLAMSRQVISSGVLLVAVTVMLLANPSLIWDIGFQLSVMATWGLIVTAAAISKRLDWLPVTLSSWIAVPIAATLWTIPLSLYHFNVIAGLSIVLNVIATPLVSVISLGGIGSSALALIVPPLGELAATLLYYPTQALLWLAQTSSKLPGSSMAIGQISLWQLLGLYAVLIASLFSSRIRGGLVKSGLAIAFLAIILLPIGWRLATQDQITILAAGDELIWVMQDHGRITLVNSGGEKTAFYTVEPFLKQAGVNRIEQAIALPFSPDYLAGWQTLLRRIPGDRLYNLADTPQLSAWVKEVRTLTPGQSSSLGKLTVQLLGTENPIVRLSTSQSWLLLPNLSLELQAHLAKAGAVLQSEILVWPGNEIESALIKTVNPKIAICYGYTLPESLERSLQQQGIQVFWTNRDGAITWDHHRGFQSYVATKHRNAPF